MMQRTSVDHYLAEGCGRCPLGGTPDCKVHRWTAELERLRSIVRGVADGMADRMANEAVDGVVDDVSMGSQTELKEVLKEELKWGVPCYTLEGKNVLMVTALKEVCCVSFFKGALLTDSEGLLVKAGPNSQAARLMKFRSMEEVAEREGALRVLIEQAVAVERAGLKVVLEPNPEPVPVELEQAFAEDPALATAFEALTPGRRRGYILFVSQPKQAKTRVARVEKCIPMILAGIGLHDAYRAGRGRA